MLFPLKVNKNTICWVSVLCLSSISPRLYKPLPESSTPEVLLPIPSDSEVWEIIHLLSQWHSAFFQNSKDHPTLQLFSPLLFLIMRKKCTHPQAEFHILSSIDQHPTIQRSNLFQKDPVGSQDAHDGRTPIEHTVRELLTSWWGMGQDGGEGWEANDDLASKGLLKPLLILKAFPKPSGWTKYI